MTTKMSTTIVCDLCGQKEVLDDGESINRERWLDFNRVPLLRKHVCHLCLIWLKKKPNQMEGIPDVDSDEQNIDLLNGEM